MGGVLKMEFHVRTASWEDLIGSKTAPWEYLFGTEQHHGKISLGQNSISLGVALVFQHQQLGLRPPISPVVLKFSGSNLGCNTFIIEKNVCGLVRQLSLCAHVYTCTDAILKKERVHFHIYVFKKDGKCISYNLPSWPLLSSFPVVLNTFTHL